MTIVYGVLAVAGLYPLGVAWRANRGTSLRYAVVWTVSAWLAWSWALLAAEPEPSDLAPARFVALCLTGVAAVAVLGARRPHVLAWNFVVLGLLAVTLLPMVETLFIGTHHVDPLRLCFLSATLAVGVLNYLPTRSAPTVLLLAVALTGELVSLFAPAMLPGRGELSFFHLLVMLAPWAAWGCWRRTRTARSEFDRLWLEFRDRWGLFWAQRVREQFNRAAGHAGWPVYLGWSGLHRTAPAAVDEAAMLETLRKALQRFIETRDVDEM